MAPPTFPTRAPRSSWTKRLITAYDHAAVQINVGNVDAQGLYTGSFKTFALCGYIRDKVRFRPCELREALRAPEGPGARARVAGASRRAARGGSAAPRLALPLPPNSTASPQMHPLTRTNFFSHPWTPSSPPSLQGESDRALRELVAKEEKE